MGRVSGRTSPCTHRRHERQSNQAGRSRARITREPASGPVRVSTPRSEDDHDAVTRSRGGAAGLRVSTHAGSSPAGGAATPAPRPGLSPAIRQAGVSRPSCPLGLTGLSVPGVRTLPTPETDRQAAPRGGPVPSAAPTRRARVHTPVSSISGSPLTPAPEHKTDTRGKKTPSSWDGEHSGAF